MRSMLNRQKAHSIKYPKASGIKNYSRAFHQRNRWSAEGFKQIQVMEKAKKEGQDTKRVYDKLYTKCSLGIPYYALNEVIH